MLSIGLMSGSSMDGIEAAVLKTDGTPHLLKAIGQLSFEYHPLFKLLLKAGEYTFCQTKGQDAFAYFEKGLVDYLRYELKLTAWRDKKQALMHYLYGQAQKTIHLQDVILHSTKLHAKAVEKLLQKTGLDAAQIAVVGYHGQVMYHNPCQKVSIIVGDGAYLAHRLKIKVVNDFRAQDILAGGQGAPFAPLYHQALAIRDQKIPLMVVNCGGIANLTFIKSAQEGDLVAFDTGPGNGLIDRLVRRRTQGKALMDKDGIWAKRGRVHQDVLDLLYQHAIKGDYFSMPPPKSLDQSDLHLLAALDALSLADACKTLAVFTAQTILKGAVFFAKPLPLNWVLAGGGWQHPVIYQTLKESLAKKGALAIKADEIGWHAQAMEAQLFAYFAVRALEKKPLSYPSTTGVPYPLSGGCVHLP